MLVVFACSNAISLTADSAFNPDAPSIAFTAISCTCVFAAASCFVNDSICVVCAAIFPSSEAIFSADTRLSPSTSFAASFASASAYFSAAMRAASSAFFTASASSLGKRSARDFISLNSFSRAASAASRSAISFSRSALASASFFLASASAYEYSPARVHATFSTQRRAHSWHRTPRAVRFALRAALSEIPRPRPRHAAPSICCSDSRCLLQFRKLVRFRCQFSA